MQTEIVWILLFAFAVLAASFQVFLFRRFGSRAFLLLGAYLAGLVVVAALVEAGAHVYGWLRPSYDVLFLEPEASVGWRQVPGLHWTWAGHDWYVTEFNVPVVTNSHGFRDRERSVPKPPDVHRAAILGDSFIEAVQVPLEDTATGRLEQKLNESLAKSPSAKRWEVLNFGISNYSVGQYLLVWEHYASRFQPDLVFAFVSGLQMLRTPVPYETGAFFTTREKRLSVRPAFELDGEELLRSSARDVLEFRAHQDALIAAEFDGSRSRRRPHGFFVGEQLRALLAALRDDEPVASRSMVSDPVFRLNARIIVELGQAVEASSGRLVVIDAFGLMDATAALLSKRLRALCETHDFGYVDVGGRFQEAVADGVIVQWPRDVHLTPEGNEVLADALLGWMKLHAGE